MYLYCYHVNMFNERWLQTVYQQWMQGQEEYAWRWAEFVRLAASINSTTIEVMEEELKKHGWFKWR
jgi:hypothetical protein